MDYPGTLRSLNQLQQKMVSANSLDELLWAITKNCAQFLRLEDFVIYTYQKKEDVLVQSAAIGEKCGTPQSILNPLRISVGEGIVGQSAQTRRPQKVDDTRRVAHYLVDNQARLSELSVPIIWNNQLIGVIDSEHHRQGFFSSTDVDLFCVIANLCAPMMSKLMGKKERKLKLGRQYYDHLIHLLEEQKVYRDKSLSLRKMAETLAISPTYLSQVIHQVGEGSFSELVNRYRVLEVKSLIQQNKHQDFNLLALAYQAGYNSKSTFNANFKLQTQLTPSQFIKRQNTTVSD